MGKSLTSAQQAEYDRLKAFLAVACDERFGSPNDSPEVHPLAVLDRLQGGSAAGALRGLREAVRDMIEAYKDAPDVERERLEVRLAASGAPSLRSVQRERSRSIFAIMERGEIRSDDEWRMISGALSDVTDRLLSGASRDAANALIASYESSRR
jgi:hypothetical protein